MFTNEDVEGVYLMLGSENGEERLGIYSKTRENLINMLTKEIQEYDETHKEGNAWNVFIVLHKYSV